jgi:glutathione S-transferase
MAAMKLYMTPGSCSTAIHIILEELEEAFEAYVVNLPAGDQFKPDYVAINPKSTFRLWYAGMAHLYRSSGHRLLAGAQLSTRQTAEAASSECRLIEAMAYIVGTIHGQASPHFRHQALPAIQPTTTRCETSAATSSQRAAIQTARSEPHLHWRATIRSPIRSSSMSNLGRQTGTLPDDLVAHYTRMLARLAVQRVLREEGQYGNTRQVSRREGQAAG